MTGRIVDIQRFSLHDGPGIRTTVFLKGCPLRCRWCHNPEGLEQRRSIRFRETACVGCGQCVTLCPCHKMVEGRHRIDFASCSGCGRCASACPTEALTLCGRDITPEETLDVARRDRAFYAAEGGVTFSGGEPLAQPSYVAAAAALLTQDGIAVAVDTCGDVPWTAFEVVLDACPLFLYDIKAVTEQRHVEGTGRPNRRILENLHRLDRTGRDIWIRVPLVHGFNDSDEELARIAQVIASLTHVRRVTPIPYHELGRSKYAQLGLPCAMQPAFTVADETVARFEDMLAAHMRPVR